MTTLKGYLSQLLQNYLDLSGKSLLEPLVNDIVVVDCFAGDKKGEGEKRGICDKLGLDSKILKTNNEKISGGEVKLEKDPSKVYEKLIRDGKAQQVGNEKDLLKILEEAEVSVGANPSKTNTLANFVATPIMEREIHAPLFESLDEHSDERGNTPQEADSEDEENESSDQNEVIEEETNQSLQSKLHYQKLSTFA